MGRQRGLQPNKFFYGFLIAAEPADIRNLIEQYESEVESIESQIIDIIYFTKGIGFDEAYGMGFKQRQGLITQISKHRKAESGDSREWL